MKPIALYPFFIPYWVSYPAALLRFTLNPIRTKIPWSSAPIGIFILALLLVACSSHEDLSGSAVAHVADLKEGTGTLEPGVQGIMNSSEEELEASKENDEEAETDMDVEGKAMEIAQDEESLDPLKELLSEETQKTQETQETQVNTLEEQEKDGAEIEPEPEMPDIEVVDVSMFNNAFIPANIEIKAGDIVRFINNERVKPHMVMVLRGPERFRGPRMAAKDEWDAQFNVTGEYLMQDVMILDAMRMTITVVE
jgi:plastocyanin